MKKYAVLAIAVVLAVLLTAAGADAFSFKFFKPLAKYAKVTPTSAHNAPAQSLAPCDPQPSSYGFCNTNSDCFKSGCNGETCDSFFSPNQDQSSNCAVPEGCDGPPTQCGCLNNQCQWATPYEFSNLHGQGQGSGPSSGQGNGQSSQGQQGGAEESQSQSYGESSGPNQGQGNGQSSQGQQGTGIVEGQSAAQGEGGSSFQCLNLAEEKKCIDGEGVHEYCTNVDGCYTTRTYYCETGENGIQRCGSNAVPTMCRASC
ncbi:MAG TPA: hypothetical protein HA224_00735 [Nanoarchaeota archaeon]|nr:hypothetical protein [Nanoarchaeota archaeon]